MKKFLILFTLLFLLISCHAQIDKEPKLLNSLNDTTIIKRGLIHKVDIDFRLDYYDVYEKDSHMEFLLEKGYQAGGPSWLGIIYGALMLSDESLLEEIRFDDESDGIAIWSKNKTTLEKISRLITVIKSDENLLLKAISAAEKNWKME